MSTIYAEFQFSVSGAGSPNALESHLDDVMDLLLDDDRVEDVDYTASLSHGSVTFTLVAEANDQAAAFTAAHSAIRSAIHGAEGATPGWEQAFQEVGSRVRVNHELAAF